jgi:prevent-host-death family protein
LRLEFSAIYQSQFDGLSNVFRGGGAIGDPIQDDATGVVKRAKMAKSRAIRGGHDLQSISAKNAKYGFGRLIDLARAEPVTVEKHGRPVVVVLAVEEYERLCESANRAAALESPRVKRPGMSRGAAKA